jgi:alkylation response protein AidB-like acyl-CoA dehydrogenase
MQQFESISQLEAAVRSYCEETLTRCASDIDLSDSIPEHVYKNLVQLRLFAFEALRDDMPAFTAQERAEVLIRVLAAIAEVSPAVAKAVMDQNFGQVGMMREFGNEFIRAKLEDIRLGRRQAAFLMTEPQSGSDLSKFETSFEQGIDGYFLSGTKDWITGAAHRQYFLVLAKEHGSAKDFGLFFIDMTRSSEGVRISDRKNKLGLRGLGEYRVELDRVFVPNHCVVIEPGHGVIRKVMSHYNLKRCGQAAIALGTTRAALRVAYDYLQARFKEDGGIPFQNTQFAFVDLYTRYVAAKALPLEAAANTLAGEQTGVSAAVAKYVCTELAVDATTRLSQLCGGNGLSDKLPLERYMRDMRMLTVAGGASQVLQASIARNLGQLLYAM